MKLPLPRDRKTSPGRVPATLIFTVGAVTQSCLIPIVCAGCCTKRLLWFRDRRLRIGPEKCHAFICCRHGEHEERKAVNMLPSFFIDHTDQERSLRDDFFFQHTH